MISGIPFTQTTMELTVYWSNLFISLSVLGVSWFLTKSSSMEAIGMALIAFVAANILENTRRFFGIAPKGSSISLAKPKRKNPRKAEDTKDDDSTEGTEIGEKNESSESIVQDPLRTSTLKTKDEIDN